MFQQKGLIVLQHRDSNGRRILIDRPGTWDPDQVPFHDAFCGGYVFNELISRETK